MRVVGRLLSVAIVLFSLMPSTALPADLPVFQGYCEEMSQRAINPAQRFLAYAQCIAVENKVKTLLQEHWSIVTDGDMKICMKYRGTMYEIRSYLDLEGCLAGLVGQRCYSDELKCAGLPL